MPAARDSQSPSLPPEAVAHLRQGRFIEAVKVVRQVHGIQLKDAKDRVDAYVASQPALRAALSSKRAEAKGALIRWLLIVGLLALLVYSLLA